MVHSSYDLPVLETQPISGRLMPPLLLKVS